MMNHMINEYESEDFSYMYKKDTLPDSKDYFLHNHNLYEVLIFMAGDSEFIVEGSVYKLQPYDIVITRENEMHQIYHRSETQYVRYVLRIKESFFKDIASMHLEKIFTDRNVGCNNVIPSESVLDSDLIEIISRIDRHVKEECDDIIIKNDVTEFVYFLNKLKNSGTTGKTRNQIVQSITEYINKNLNNEISLDELSDKFFVSKYHMCRVFKENTGFTINQYIRRKRILLAQKLCKSGTTLSEAALLSGFSDYSSFYKAFIKETGTSPRQTI